MADLHITYDKLRRAVGLHLGSGRSTSDWDANAETDINRVIESGLRAVYYPVLDEKTGETYRWSFLEQDLPVSLVASQSDYTLPENFASLKAAFTFPPSAESRPIASVPPAHLRALQARRAATGTPLYCSIREAAQVPGQRSRKLVSFYPAPDSTSALVVTARMAIEPTMLSESNPYPLGGMLLSEAILESCLAAADKLMNPEAGPGIHAELFRRHLLVAIDADRQIAAAEQAEEFAAWPLDGITAGITSLEVNKAYLDRAIGQIMGYGPNPDAWTHSQASQVSEIRRRGLRNFYTPQVLPGEKHAHRWSFLNPLHQVDMVEGVYAYTMPADFSVPPRLLTFAPSASVLYDPLPVIPPEHVEHRLQVSTSSGRPTVAAFRPKVTTPTIGTRWELILSPVPSEAYTLTFHYGFNPDQLGSEVALPLGGQPHAQTVLEACLAEAEIALGEGDTHQQRFLVCLQSSVDHDRNVAAPETLGYSRDRSDGDWEEQVYGNTHGYDDHLTLYAGQVW